ncbi:uncharacterized protein LOC128745148 [Sabethes cyaneus]|uniref:uncharacterized protein LOC128745148 n=1 Tax=Sabethes cyaneus TaxID=53552 RepID=UPI00237EB06F|nr:uncharacterized protein LOC128745148 [Sabethes cyaneus]
MTKTDAILLIVFVSRLGYVAANTAYNDDNSINPGWIKPDPWSRYEHESQKMSAVQLEDCQCPPTPTCPSEPLPSPADKNNQLALQSYKKFVVRLFAENTLFPATDSDYLLRNLQLKVKPDQLEELKNAETARKIDGIVAGIFEQSKEDVYLPIAESLCLNATLLLQKIGENVVLWYLVIAVVGLILFNYLFRYLSTVLHIPRWLCVALLFGAISYTKQFHECNEELEAAAIAKLHFPDSSNPCNQLHDTQKGWFHGIQTYFGKDPEAECRERLLEAKGVGRTTCDPTEVLVGLIAKIQLKYIQSLVSEIFGALKKNTESAGFLEKIIILCLFLSVFYMLFSITFRCGFEAFFDFLARPRHPTAAPVTGRTHESIMSTERSQSTTTAAPAITLNINVSQAPKKISRKELNRVEELARSSNALALEPNEGLLENGSGDAPIGEEDTSESEVESDVTHIACQSPVSATDPEGNTRSTKDKPPEVNEKKSSDIKNSIEQIT